MKVLGYAVSFQHTMIKDKDTYSNISTDTHGMKTKVKLCHGRFP